MKLKTAQIPSMILTYVTQKLGRKIRKFNLDQSGKVFVGIPWHEADRQYFQMFKLEGFAKNKITVSPSERSLEVSGWGEGYHSPDFKEKNFEIPSGFVVVMVGIYPERCTIYTAKDAPTIEESLPKKIILSVDSHTK